MTLLLSSPRVEATWAKAATAWKEIAVEDKRNGPAELAACRLDFAAWLETSPGRQRKIATALATGETTGVVARKSGLPPARISQLRRELQES